MLEDEIVTPWIKSGRRYVDELTSLGHTQILPRY